MEGVYWRLILPGAISLFLVSAAGWWGFSSYHEYPLFSSFGFLVDVGIIAAGLKAVFETRKRVNELRDKAVTIKFDNTVKSVVREPETTFQMFEEGEKFETQRNTPAIRTYLCIMAIVPLLVLFNVYFAESMRENPGLQIDGTKIQTYDDLGDATKIAHTDLGDSLPASVDAKVISSRSVEREEIKAARDQIVTLRKQIQQLRQERRVKCRR